jgi:enoyl-CoA hydratase/carnithine racemase
LVFEKKIKILAEGIMLGGLFTLIYSIGRSFASEDAKYSFLVVSIGLVIVIYLGYHRFVRAPKPKTAKS